MKTIMRKKISAAIIVCMLLCYTLALPVSAATGVFGNTFKFTPFTLQDQVYFSGYIANAAVTEVRVTLNNATASVPYRIEVEDPNGRRYSYQVSGALGTQVFTFPVFRGVNPAGIWRIRVIPIYDPNTNPINVRVELRVTFFYP